MPRIRRMARFIAEIAPVALRETVGLLGCISVVYGTQLIYRPAGYIVAGAMLIFFVAMLARPETTIDE